MFSRSHLARVSRRAAACVLALASLASCGGGTYQVQAFQPSRILSFGDESSLLLPDGRKYSINGVDSTTHLVDCSLAPLWIQTLAASFGMVYPECNPQAVSSPAAHSYALLGADVDSAITQVSAFQSSDSFTPGDLVTLLIGVNDVLEVYNESANTDQTAVLAEMHSRGLATANLVNQIAATGAKVLIVTIPDMGTSPFAATENERGDFDRAGLLSNMSNEFNRTLRANIVNDGSKIGLVLMDDYTYAAGRRPSSYGFVAANVAGCLDTAPLPGCSLDTIRADYNGVVTTASNYMWADATHLGSVAQYAMGTQATTRAHSNPF